MKKNFEKAGILIIGFAICLRLPQSTMIPLTITVRYFPALRQEYQPIRDAMKLRRIHGPIRKLEFIAAVLILSASAAADDLLCPCAGLTSLINRSIGTSQ